MPKRPSPPQPPPLSSWDIYKVAKRAVWLGTVEAPDKSAAIEKAESLSKDEKMKLVQAAHKRLLSGFRDNTWFLQTRGTDYDLAPPAAQRVNVVRTIYAEADGAALPDPDPGAKGKKEFAWMTAHEYRPNKSVSYPFKDWKTLEAQR